MGRIVRRRERRELELQMRELDRLDQQPGPGPDPRQQARHLRRRAPRWVGGLGWVSCVVAVTVVMSILPGPMRDPLRHALHLPDLRIAAAVDTSARGAYAFERTQPGTSTPVSYSPCKPIHYVVNPDGGPDDSLVFIKAAVAEASRRSGFDFAYDGTTTDRAFDRSSGPVLIGFARPGELGELPENGDAVGIGGSTFVVEGNGFDHAVTGMVALKTSWFRRADATGHRAEERAVVMHELGHVLGLAHVDDPGELMYPSVTRTSYGSGDIEGLAKLGAVRCG
ncbi:hypothetical protein GCM10009798_42210 [Nocardioides panacihumi]|uniref:Peptidase M10 metallopeptidase domain-containing protein n=1 Tax=Nocardioides panacihumi TaxID=400774 RepID=A0ABP5DA60_9ACTN